MNWLRLYHGTATDPKLTAVALTAGTIHCVSVAAWICILEHASEAENRGSIEGLSAKLMAIGLRIDLAQAQALLAAFEEEGLIAGGRVVAWDKRQRGSDDGAKRVADWRKRKKVETTPEGGNGAGNVEGASQGTVVTLRAGKKLSHSEQSRAEQNREDKIQNPSGQARVSDSRPSPESSPDGSPPARPLQDEFPIDLIEGVAAASGLSPPEVGRRVTGWITIAEHAAVVERVVRAALARPGVRDLPAYLDRAIRSEAREIRAPPRDVRSPEPARPAGLLDQYLSYPGDLEPDDVQAPVQH